MAPRGTVTNQNSQTERLDLWGLLNAPTPTLYNGALPAELAGKATTAYVITDDSTASTGHGISQGPIITPTIGKFYIASAYFHAVAGAGWAARFDNNSASGRYVNLATGAVGSGGGGTGFFQASDAGGGWYRLSYLYQCTQAANSFYSRVYLAAGDGAAVYTGTGGANQIAVCGVMHEEAVPGQLTPSPYVASGATSGVGPRDYGENFLQQSEDQSKSPWVATQLTPTGGAALSPGGTQTATSLIPSGVNGAHYISQPVALTSYTGPTAFRARVKASGYSWCRLQLLSGASTNTAVYYNLGTGAVGTTSVGAGATLIGTPLAIPVPGYSGWYDLFFSASSTSGWQTAYLAVTIDGAGSAFSGDGVSGILSWGLQLSRTNQLSDYRKTTSGIWVPSGAPRLAVL